MGAFFLRLFYFGIHENRTACPKIDGVFGKQGGLCEIFHRIIQRFCEGLDKRAAARGAGFIQLDAVHSLIFDFDAFHVLAADV